MQLFVTVTGNRKNLSFICKHFCNTPFLCLPWHTNWLNLDYFEFMLFFLITVFAVYLGMVIGIYVLQEWFFFHPEKLPVDFKFDYSMPFEELFFETEKGAKINALHFKVNNPKGVVFYLKGNSRSIKGWGKFARDFTGIGYDLVMFDYRGFGKSTGKRTEESMYFDSQVIYEWVKTKFEEEAIIVYGRSMGSGFATRIAADNQPKMLILDAPYYSFFHLIQRYAPIVPVKRILRYKIYSHHFIKKVDCPVFVFHGTHDWTVPFSAGLRLTRSIGTQGQFIPIRGAGHNNLRSYPKYHEYLYYILTK